mgnify:CR=1 FL=1
MESMVKFLVGSQEEYDSLEVKDDKALYFIMNTHRIYRGDTLFASGLLENLEQNEVVEFYGGSAIDVLKEGE